MSTKQSNATTQQVADRLVELCSTGKFEKAQEELFAEDVVSIEPESSQMPEKKVEGLNAIKEKGKQFQSMVKENHGLTVSEPLVMGNYFSVALGMDVTMKDGKRSQMDELIVYHVKDGKVVSEQFFY